MRFFSRLSNGWKLAMASFEVLKKNKQLIIFPLLSGTALLLTIGSFLAIILSAFGWNIDIAIRESSTSQYVITFCFYLVNYFIIVFFNMALVHCSRLYFEGEKPSVSQGLSFSLSRIGDIFAWAVLAATVGLLLNMLEEYLGKVGQIISGLLGLAWSITTFFVIPVIAYEHAGPIEAFKRSASIMKEKWGESLGANFSFGIVSLVGYLIIALPLFIIGMLINPAVGIALAVLSGILITTVVSASKIIFISAVYHHIKDNAPVPDFDDQTLDGIFMEKQKKGIF